ncbi:pyridoxamine 5'-phosphate oxidase family protein [Candidatus Poribacteria bacterium]|nr:pyridoxamine 5'-phosphate oxidase family protein [Candidatus Poribacteria bacterium]
MNLKEYFENTQGLGIIASADAEGKVDTAVYSKPIVMDNDTIAFIMADNLTHSNVKVNPYTSYMFIEDTSGYKGKRLYLKMTKEETDPEIIDKYLDDKRYKSISKFLVYFHVDNIRPLVGDKA